MPDLKISQLPAASTPLAGTELVPIVQGGTTDQTTVQAILTSAVPSGTANGVLFLNGSKVVTSGSGLTFDGTNLGVGTSSPDAKLRVNGGENALQARFSGVSGRGLAISTFVSGGVTDNGVIYNAGLQSDGQQVWQCGGTERMRLDSSGNLGLGVTPSAWVSNRRVLEIGGTAAALALNGSAAISEIFANAIRDTGGAYRYFANGAASYVDFNNSSAGGWSWAIAPSGTAGNPISFTQAMTLDASGFLALGQTSASFQFDVLSGAAPAIRARASNSNNVLIVESTGTTSSSIRFINTSANNIYINANAGDLELYTANTARLRLKSTGQLRYVPLAADPAGAENGDVYYNSSTNKLRLYAAGAWVDLN